MITNPTTIEEIKANREEWAAALESGKYAQTTGALRDDDEGGFCCLGVACDISGVGTWAGELYRIAEPKEELFGDLENSHLCTALGLTFEMMTQLVEANDGDVTTYQPGATFPDIAAMIRALPLPEEVPA